VVGTLWGHCGDTVVGTLWGHCGDTVVGTLWWGHCGDTGGVLGKRRHCWDSMGKFQDIAQQLFSDAVDGQGSRSHREQFKSRTVRERHMEHEY